jgi:pectate lyase
MLWGGGKDGDGIALKKTTGCWIHNNDVFYGLPGSDNDQVKGDGSMDLKDDSQYVTISYNHFWDSGKSSLCGMKKETGPNYISYHHNWFDHSDSRHPRIRTMSVHIYNNYYEGVYSYGVGITYGGSAFVESNYFKNTRYPMLISRQGSELLEQGYLSSEDGGIIKSYGNVMVNQVSWVPYSKNKVEFDSYDVSKRTDTVPNTVKAKLGGAIYNNFDTDSSVMYSYTPDNAKDVPTIVMSWKSK